jgi:hypothetical protein
LKVFEFAHRILLSCIGVEELIELL